MGITNEQREIINRCRTSAIWFMQKFVKIKHQGAGIVPFDPFEYQKSAIRSFRKNRLNIFRKTRQCFIGDQVVHTPDGNKPISAIRAGDRVWSYAPTLSDDWCLDPCYIPQFQEATVNEVYVNPAAPLCRVMAGRHESITTRDHRYFTTRGEVPAGDLRPGDWLIAMSQFGLDEVDRLEVDNVSYITGDSGPLYDLNVEQHHNYVVNGAVVHNCGISKVSGIFALWFAMFSPHKTILIVSRKDEDAMSFLAENVKLPFDNLPDWMKKTWLPPGSKNNDHEIQFSNGSIIKSLTSHPDVLRSNSSALNIIDEAAFINDMDAMWAAGWPTLQHGGSVIVISTTNGVGNWYWNTWTDAEAGANDFKPLMINWWDMTWRIEYRDTLSGEHRAIAPTDGIVPTATGTYGYHPRYGKIDLDPKKYGKFWSPWLEEQYRGLQEKGEAWKFSQEVLAAFIGSGNTVVPTEVLQHIETTVVDEFRLVDGPQIYVHPVSGDQELLDFTPGNPGEGLWIWKPPVRGTPDKIKNGRIIEAGIKAHAYVIGVDNATGKGKDFHGLEVIDVDEMEQVCEGMFHCRPSDFTKMIDRIGREYNTALLVPERNNGGDHIIDDLVDDYAYPRVWRRAKFNGKTVTYEPFGHYTSSGTKPALNKFLLDYLRDKPGEGVRIYSRRLLKQLLIYVRKRDKAGRDTGKTEAESGAGNHDDLVMAFAMALCGLPDAIGSDGMGGMPYRGEELTSMPSDPLKLALAEKRFAEKGGVLIPMSFGGDVDPQQSIQEELLKFALQLGGLPLPMMAERIEPTHKKKHELKYRKKS